MLTLQTLLFEWAWTQSAGCNISRQSLDSMRRLFNRKSVAFFGDSHMRRFHAYLEGRLVRGGSEPALVSCLRPGRETAAQLGCLCAQVWECRRRKPSRQYDWQAEAC